jgi:hypothetical protein
VLIDLFIVVFSLWGLFNRYYKKFPYASFIFLCMYVAYIYAGTIMMYYDDFYSTNPFFKEMVFLVRTGYVSILTGIMLAHFTIKRRPLEDLVVSRVRYSETLAIDFVFIFVFLVSVSYLSTLGENPLKVMFFNPIELANVRSASTTDFKYFSFFSNFLYFLLPIFFPIYYFLARKKVAFFILLTAVLLQLSTGQKSPIFYLLILMLISVYLYEKNFSYKKSAIWLFIGLIMLFFIIYIQNRHLLNGLNFQSIELVWSGLKTRMFYGGVLPILQYVEYFSSVHEFYGFSSLNAPSDQMVHLYFYPDTGITGTVNTVSLADFYARFGNVLLSGFLFFLVVYSIVLLDIVLFNKINKPVDAAIYTMFCMTTLKLIITDWYTVLPQFINLSFWLLGAIMIIDFFVRNIVDMSGTNHFFYSKSRLYFYFSVLLFLYVTQGQIKGLLLA